MSIPEKKQYIADFEQLGFGMFVHWGLYSQLGQGEWIQNVKRIEKNEYIKLAQTFTAEDFDAEELAKTARNAGCRYIVLTTRHHEGFSLYDTCGLSEFDSLHSPSGRDIIREYVDACRKYDIIPFFYHTTLDWYNEDFDNDFDKYLDYLRQSVEILCKNYGKIGGLWFDGNWSKPNADWKEDELYATIRKYQPEAIIVNNTGLEARGEIGNPEIDSVTFEQGRPTPMNREGHKKYVAAEMCYTINDHWGIGKNDLNYKSPQELIEALCDCRRAGANYLLNIGPEAQGRINPYQKELFGVIGRWMDKFGDAVHNGRPCDISTMGRSFVLKSEDNKKLYFFIYDLGVDGSSHVTVSGKYYGSIGFNSVKEKVKKIYWMDNNEEIKFIQGKDMLCADFSGYEYGNSYCVRVACADID